MNFYSLPGIVGFLKKLNLLYYEQALFTFLLDLTQQDINARDDPGSQEGGPRGWMENMVLTTLSVVF